MPSPSSHTKPFGPTRTSTVVGHGVAIPEVVQGVVLCGDPHVASDGSKARKVGVGTTWIFAERNSTAITHHRAAICRLRASLPIRTYLCRVSTF